MSMVIPPLPPLRPRPSLEKRGSSSVGGRPRGTWGPRGECRAITLRLPPKMLEAIKEMAGQGQVTQATCLHYLIWYALARHGWTEGLSSPFPKVQTTA